MERRSRKQGERQTLQLKRGKLMRDEEGETVRLQQLSPLDKRPRQ
jgi:hypothetical protein